MGSDGADRTRIIERTTLLAAAPSEVFEAVNSEETAPLIDPACRVWRPDTDPVAVGTHFTIRGRLGIVPIRGVSEVVRWEPPDLASYRSVRPVWPFRMEAEHRFGVVDADPEQTRYTWTVRFYEVNRIARPLIAIAVRLLTRAMSAQADALSSYLSGRQPQRNPPDTGIQRRC